MNTIIWSLNAENDTLQNFAEYVRQYGVSFFEDSPIKFEYKTQPNLPADIQLSGVQRKNLFLIMKEAFHNILKHSNAAIATANIVLQKNTLQIEVTDNGNGLSNENKFGNGLKNMQKRMNEIGGEIQFLTDHGTVIKFSLKL